MKKILAATLISSMLFTGGLALAQDDASKTQGKHEPRNPIMREYKKLDLSDAQQEQLKAIFKDGDQAKNAGKRGSMHEEMQALIQADTLDEEKLKTTISQHSEEMQAHMFESAKKHHEAWKILTPEQREKLTSMKEERKDKMQKGHKKDHGHDHNHK